MRLSRGNSKTMSVCREKKDENQNKKRGIKIRKVPSTMKMS